MNADRRGLRVDFRWVAAAAMVALLALLPRVLAPYWVIVVTGAFFYAIMASSWSLLAGIAGQFSFAHMAFAGIGAYTAGLLARDLGASPLAGILAGTILAGLIGLIIGLLCLRLRAAYLALFTIAFSELFRIALLTEFQFTEGSNGLQLGKLWEAITGEGEYYVMLALLLVAMAFMYWLAGSRVGLFLRSLREDQEAEAAMGVNVVRFKDLPDETKQRIRAARWMLIHGLASLVGNGWFETPLTSDSIFSDEMGFKLVEFLKKVNRGLYEEFKTG